MGKLRVIHWGLGAMGGGMVRLMQEKPSLESVGAIDTDPNKAGRDLGPVVGLQGELGIKVSSQPGEVLGKTDADLLLLATSSFTREVFPQIKQALEAGLNVITIAEEMAFPWANEPKFADELDRLAKAKGLTVLGTGINPGFILDTLIIALTGACEWVEKIRAARINDLSPFGATVMRTQGVGTTPEQFTAGVEAGSIVGHVGFPESMHLIASALGWKLDRIEQVKEPIISNVYRETPVVKVEPGMVAGCRHTAKAYVGDKVVMEFEHPQQIHPHLEGVETGDYVWIEGRPNFNVSNKPECPGGIGTIAMAVNMIPAVVDARPGMLTMADLPLPRSLKGRM
ncbi:MAG: 2,4-diaminopentanoate dehydrogenase [Bacillota bacterium]